MPLATAMARRALVALPVACALAAGSMTALAGGGSAPERSGRQIYLGDCATCHGVDGRGSSRGPTLQRVGPASVDFMVRSGRMPLPSPDAPLRRRDPVYEPGEEQRLIVYASSLTDGGPSIPRVDLRRADLGLGGQAYRLQCAACHSWAGNGGALVDRAAPSVAPASPVEIAEAIRTGPGTMPVFGRSAIPDRKLDDVVAYTRHLRDPEDRGGWPLAHLGPLAEGAAGLVLGLGGLLVVTRSLGARR